MSSGAVAPVASSTCLEFLASFVPSILLVVLMAVLALVEPRFLKSSARSTSRAKSR